MFLITGNECERRSEQNDDPNNDMNPGGMGVNRDGREENGKEGDKNAMDHTGRRKGNS